MELLLISIYAGFCIAIFKIFSLPLNKWTVPTAILGGVVMIGAMLLLMNYNHPYTTLFREYFATTPIVPDVRGRVISVEAEANKPMKQGDVLFTIDPTPYQAAVDAKKAELVEAELQVEQLRENVNAAIAEVEVAQAQVDQTEDAYTRVANVARGDAGAVSEREVEARRLNFESAKSDLSLANTRQRQAELELSAEYQGENARVARIRNELVEAQFDLDNTTVRAPTDGYVTQVILRPGMMAVPLPLRPVMVFIHTRPEDRALVGAFWQNSLQRIKIGDEVEVIYKAVPGRVFKGHVDRVLPVVAQGQLQASGELLSVEAVSHPGQVPVVIKLEDDLSQFHLPAGVVGSAAIYTEHAHHVAIMRKILLRMVSWQNYIFGELH